MMCEHALVTCVSLFATTQYVTAFQIFSSDRYNVGCYKYASSNPIVRTVLMMHAKNKEENKQKTTVV